MHEGRVVHFGDYKGWHRIVADDLEGSPHTLVGYATSLVESLGMLERISGGEIPANVVIFGEGLSETERRRRDHSPSDPRTIVNRIGELGLSVRIIWFAERPMKDYGVEADLDIGKGHIEPGEIARAIDDLPELEA